MSAKEHKRAQKGAKGRKRGKKERFRAKIANNQVWNNQVWELPTQPYWRALNERALGFPAVLSRGIPGEALRACSGSFLNVFWDFLWEVPAVLWGYGLKDLGRSKRFLFMKQCYQLVWRGCYAWQHRVCSWPHDAHRCNGSSSRTKNHPKEEVLGRTSRAHPGVISRGYPGLKLRSGRSNWKTSISARTSMTRKRGRPRPQGTSKNFGHKKLWAEFSFPTSHFTATCMWLALFIELRNSDSLSAARTQRSRCGCDFHRDGKDHY